LREDSASVTKHVHRATCCITVTFHDDEPSFGLVSVLDVSGTAFLLRLLDDQHWQVVIDIYFTPNLAKQQGQCDQLDATDNDNVTILQESHWLSPQGGHSRRQACGC